MNMKKVVIADSVRTAWGKPGAGLAPFMSSDFSAKLLNELLARTGVEAAAVDQVVFGQAHPSTMPNNIGHYAWLKAELPVEVPGVTVQSCSGSALQALRSCYYLIATGNENICVAGGADSYSAAPFALRDVRNHFYPQHRTFIDTLEEAELYTQPEPMGRQEQYELAHGETVSAEAVAYAKEYMFIGENESPVWGMIRTAFASVSDWAIIPMQDFLELGAEGRMNFPGTMTDCNWTWRAEQGFATDALAERIRKLTVLYGRLPQIPVKETKK